MNTEFIKVIYLPTNQMLKFPKIKYTRESLTEDFKRICENPKEFKYWFLANDLPINPIFEEFEILDD
jgi:hypothetical protein